MNLSKKSKEILIQTIFLQWYKKNKRNLPWRRLQKNKLPNPYYIFVSEYMLQQTTVASVKKKFQEFIIKWPTINHLVKISEENILNFWAGLGYYSRARNLLKAAKIIHKDFNGIIPNIYEDLINLPGVGDYTAKAILSIAYNKPVMPIDANIERIIARIYAIKSPIIKIKTKLKNHSEVFISKKSSTNLIQAFMDYGSIICTPRKPKCNICKIKLYCRSFNNNIQETIPSKLKSKSKKPRKYSRAYIFLNEKNEILIRKRPSRGMLASMLEVPNDKWEKNKNNLVKDAFIKNINDKFKLKGSVEYSFSHFDLQTDVFFKLIKKNHFPKSKWIKKEKIAKSGLPTIMKKIIEVAI